MMLAVHTDSKSTFHPSRVSLALDRAAAGMVGIDEILPVVWNGRVLGHMWGHRDSNMVGFRQWCGFSNYDDVISEVTGGKRHASYFSRYISSNATQYAWVDMFCNAIGQGFSAGAFSGTAHTARQFTDTTTGSIPHGGDVSTDTKHLATFELGQLHPSTGQPTAVIVYDRVLSYDQCALPDKTTSTENRTLTNTLTAQRYCSAGQAGLRPMIVQENNSVTDYGNVTAMSYTNQAGTAGQALPNAILTSVSVSAGSIGNPLMGPYANTSAAAPFITRGPFLPLATGDQGMRSIQSYTITCNTATGFGTFTTACLALVRPLVACPVLDRDKFMTMETLTGVAGLPRVYDGACLNTLAQWNINTGAQSGFYGKMDFIWG